MKTISENAAKKGVISPNQLFFIFLVSRAVVALTFYQSIMINGITPDSLISSLSAVGINLLLCTPSYLCVKNGKNPLDSKFLSAFYLAYFIFFAGVNISRFAFFACDKTDHSDSPLLFIVIMAAAACYAAHLGIEAVGRFSVLCAVVSIMVLSVIVLLNFKNFRPINFMPFFEGNGEDILKNGIIFSSNSIEGALYLMLEKKTSKKTAKPLFFGIIAAYIAIMIMLLFCIGVLGRAARLFSFPVYTLFQMTAFKSFSRLDIIYAAFGFFSLFTKCAVIIYCAEEITPILKRKAKPAVLFFVIVAVSFMIYRRYYSEIVSNTRWFYALIAAVFLVIIPILYLIFAKRKKVSNENCI